MGREAARIAASCDTPIWFLKDLQQKAFDEKK